MKSIIINQSKRMINQSIYVITTSELKKKILDCHNRKYFLKTDHLKFAFILVFQMYILNQKSQN